MGTPCLFKWRVGRGVLWTAVLATSPLPEIAAADPIPVSIPWRLGYDVSVDEVGRIEQRMIADLAEARCVWWVSGDAVLVRRQPAPAGMVEETCVPHNPLSDMEHRVGVDAGPLVFGPLRPLGGFRRAIDPTTGGVVSSTDRQQNRLALDSSLEPSSWSGVGLSLSHRREARYRVAVRGGYLTSPNRANVVIGTTEVAPFHGRLGEVRVVAARSEALDEGRPVRFDPSDEAWMSPARPVRSRTTTRIGVAYVLDRGGYGDPNGTAQLPIDLLVEGWREGESYEIRRHAGCAAVAIGYRRLRGAARGVVAETGFVDIEGTPPLRSSYVGGRVEGTLRPRTETIRSLELRWRGEIDRSQGWDDGVPDVPEWVQRYHGDVVTGGVFRRITIEYVAPLHAADDGAGGGSADGDDEPEISSALRVAVPIGAATKGTATKGTVSVLTATSDLSFTTSPELTERGVSWELTFDRTTMNDRRGSLSWRLRGDEGDQADEGDADWEWTHSFSLLVPFGKTAEIEGRCTVASYGKPDAEITGSIRFRWYRSGVLPRELPSEVPGSETED